MYKPKVSAHGRLRAVSGKIVDASGHPFVLRGMSLFWSQWMPQFYNLSAVRWLRDDWAVNAVRAAMAVNYGGYKSDRDREWAKVCAVIEAAKACDIYVVVDWHAHELELVDAIVFFERLSSTYAECENLIYETWNEPYPVYGWAEHIRPYHDLVIQTIRRNSPDSLIIAGTPHYSLRPDIAALMPLKWQNVAYAVHFYAGTHGQAVRDYCQAALNAGITLLASEYGTCESNGGGILNFEEMDRWWYFLETHAIGHFNWSIADKTETSAALLTDAQPNGGWDSSQISPSGEIVRNYLRSLAAIGGQQAISDQKGRIGYNVEGYNASAEA